MIQGRPGRLTLVALYGLGDSYLVSALSEAARQHSGQSVTVVLKDSHAAVGRLFGDKIRVETESDSLIRSVENDSAFYQTYENKLEVGRPYFVHPHFIRSGVRVDHLTVKATTTQADMYRALLHLPMDATLTQPYKFVPTSLLEANSVLLIPEARSWPNTHPMFWERLYQKLSEQGRAVYRNNAGWPLAELMNRAATVEWVIGPQCGLMSILNAAQFPCRKTFVTPSIDNSVYPGLPLKRTFPYAYATKFLGRDYDIEEFKVDGDDEEVIERLLSGKNGLRLGKHDPKPVTSITVDISPGDFFDRLSILAVKMKRFSADKRALVAKEFYRLSETAEPIFAEHGGNLKAAYGRLIAANTQAFVHNEIMVRATFENGGGESHHVQAVRANKTRVEIKQEINDICGSAFREQKSYYS